MFVSMYKRSVCIVLHMLSNSNSSTDRAPKHTFLHMCHINAFCTVTNICQCKGNMVWIPLLKTSFVSHFHLLTVDMGCHLGISIRRPSGPSSLGKRWNLYSLLPGLNQAYQVWPTWHRKEHNPRKSGVNEKKNCPLGPISKMAKKILPKCKGDQVVSDYTKSGGRWQEVGGR